MNPFIKHFQNDRIVEIENKLVQVPGVRDAEGRSL